ncbi:MAG: hypothetical protein IJ802_06000 [Kiritimatiellae bacterium]|nr:hypothetical protein [Kiritimatiellia bacterium]
MIPVTLQMVGNATLLDLRKTAFLSSRRTSSAAALKCHEWALDVRNSAQCVITGAQSALEKHVFTLLLAGSQPLILVLARALWQEIPAYLRPAIGSGRLLAISPIASTATRVTQESALARNRYIIREANEIVFGSLDESGSLASLLREFPALPYRILSPV